MTDWTPQKAKRLRLLGSIAALALLTTFAALGLIVVLTAILAAGGLVEVEVSTR